LIGVLLLVACQPAAAPQPTEAVTAEATQAATAEATEAANQTTMCTNSEAPATLADLGGKDVTIAVENAYPPFNSKESGQEGQGWDYDAGTEICKRLNCNPVFTEAAWDGIFPAMAAGEYDVLFDGVTYTDERAQSVAFSCAYVRYGQVLLVRSDESRFATPNDFKADASLKAATQLGTTNEIIAQKLVGADRVQSFDDFGLAVQALLSGDVDAVVIDKIAAVGFIKENEGKLKTLDESITSSEQLALVFQPGSDLIEPFDGALAAMAKDGTLEQINNKWFNP
jgi:polar amino acid transport system substrate-binding protein